MRTARCFTSRPPDAARGGYALPWALLCLAILGLLAAAGFLIAWLDGRSSEAFARGTEAFYAAEGGLATAIASAVGPAPAPGSLSIGRASARFSYEKLLDLGRAEALFLVRSEGAVRSGGTRFRRRVAQVAWVPAPPRVPGALVVVGSATASGAVGRVRGSEAGAGCPSAQPTPVAGVALWGGPFAAPGVTVTGAPPIRAIPPGTSFVGETGLRWSELLGPYGPYPDATVPPDAWPPAARAGAWPYVRVVGPATLGPPESGAGTLVVDGDLTLLAGFSWTGLVLVGDALRIGGHVRVQGAVVAGIAGPQGTVIDLGGGRVEIDFDSCAVARAAGPIVAAARPVPGSWHEIW